MGATLSKNLILGLYVGLLRSKCLTVTMVHRCGVFLRWLGFVTCPKKKNADGGTYHVWTHFVEGIFYSLIAEWIRQTKKGWCVNLLSGCTSRADRTLGAKTVPVGGGPTTAAHYLKSEQESQTGLTPPAWPNRANFNQTGSIRAGYGSMWLSSRYWLYPLLPKARMSGLDSHGVANWLILETVGNWERLVHSPPNKIIWWFGCSIGCSTREMRNLVEPGCLEIEFKIFSSWRVIIRKWCQGCRS